jgi:hypothetical protein
VQWIWLASVLAVACASRAPRRETRTDLAPLASRVNLPASGISDVRWVAVPEHEAGCDWVPEPDRSYRFYASATLDAAAWASLNAPGAATTLVLPTDIAQATLPAKLHAPSLPSTIVSGTEIPTTRLSKAEHVSITRAVRAGNTLVLELFVSRN